MIKVIVFIILSIPIIIISRRTFFNVRNHGLYRFVSWECILWLAVSNYSYWFTDPFSMTQAISWILLFYASWLAIAGYLLLKKTGMADHDRQDDTLFGFEKTTELVETGLYKYIRHPLYGSLLFLSWGIFFKNPDYILLAVSVMSGIFLILTVRMEEKENIGYFGEAYKDYMKKTKMFVPFIF